MVRRRSLAYGALLAALPLAQAALDRRWLFDGPGRDPWIYYGYFRFARVYLEEAASAYYSSRLSVILPGHLVRTLLPAVPANVVLHLGLYACAVAAFYGSTRIYTGRRAALLASLVLGCQPYFLWAMGSNYVPGFGITYFLVALAAIAAAASRPGGRAAGVLLAAAGAAAVALVAANLFYALYLPLLAAHFLALNRHGARRRLLPAALWAAAGGAVAFAGLDGVGWFWGHGAKVFLAATVRWLWDFSRRTSIYKHPLAIWGLRAWWLVFPAIVLGGSLASLLRRQRETRSPAPGAAAGGGEGGGGGADGYSGGSGSDRGGASDGGPSGLQVFVQVQYVAACAVMAACELEPHGMTLEYFYYALLLLPPACLALAGQLAPLLDRLPPRVFAGLAVATVAVLAPLSVGLAQPWDASRVPTIALPLAAGAVALAVLAAGRRGLGPAILVMSSLAVALLLTPNLFDRRLRRYGGYADSPRFFEQVDSTLSRLRAADPSLRLRLWYSVHEEDGGFYDSLACAWRLCGRLVTFSFPDVAGGRMCDGQPLQPGMKVAVLSERPPPAAAAAAEGALESIGLRARWLGASSIPGPVRPISLLFFETAALPRPRGPGGGSDHGLPGAGAADPGAWRNGGAATAGRTAPPR
jgi:hypothetical protein